MCGVARDGQYSGTGLFESHGAPDQVRNRIFTAVKDGLRSLGNPGIRINDDRYVVLIGLCRGQANDLPVKICGGLRTHPAQDTDNAIRHVRFSCSWNSLVRTVAR